MLVKKILIALVIFSSFACVTQKKYDELLAEKVKTDAEKMELEDKVEMKNNTIESLESQLLEAQEELEQSKKAYQASQSSLDSLQQQYETLNDYYDKLMSSSGKLNKDLSNKEKQLLQMEADLEISKQRNDELAANLAEREERVAELEKVLADKEAAVNALKQKVSEALLNFKENDLTVEVKNGKVYVSLAEQLLFNSGSTVVDAKGAEALKKLAQVLKDSRDVNIVVEGHTDNVPISGNNKYLKDNWDLSVLRATSIVRILTQNGASPDRVTAAGKGEFAPKAANENAEGRKENRRTEIILTPKLDELFQILESN
ncbi:OmpA family protein [Marivirga harenae]|uniref:OmpA/MotB family protein n=1 Tax=Marivirga harenae TaxID=2010992 RepID=UPI0026E0D048|nr:OmpA family protein [Marivirga harenae]WKV11658.1 OmpA family protein [Marivirga harenae]|tara:strand:- start:165089 stop:166036 length:948 start_codon:yes stop_codon:yes gene_type:complete